MFGSVVRATLAVMEHVPPPAEELALLDRELARLDARRSQLLTRRAWLLSVLRPPAPRPAAPPGATGGTGSPPPPFDRPAQAGAGGAQNVLLTLGGLLLAVAAIAFTLVSWGHLGIGGRSAVLATVTVGALAAPVVLLRRGLPSTAEVLAALASVLLVLDAYALHRVAAPGAGALGFTAAASAVLAVVWAAYGLLLGRLRMPLPTAVVSAQLPLVLWAWSQGAHALVFGWALLATAAFDCLVALRGRGVGVRVTACVGGGVTGSAALLVGLGESLSAASVVDAVTAGLLLLGGAAVALAASWRAKGFAVAGGVVAGLCAVAALGGVGRAVVGWGWSVPLYLACAVALLAAVRAPLPRPAARGLGWASLGVVFLAVLSSAAPVVVALLGTFPQLGRVWSGEVDAIGRGAWGTAGLPWSAEAAAPVALLAVAGLLGAALPGWSRVRRAAEGVVPSAAVRRGTVGAWALGIGWAGLTVVPDALEVPYAAAVCVRMALVGAALVVTVYGLRAGWVAVARTALVCALAGSVSVGFLSLAVEGATYGVFGVLLVAFAAASTVRAAGPGARTVAGEAARAVWACAAVVCGMVLAWAVGASWGLGPARAALLMLAVPAVTVALGARLRRDPVGVAVEVAGGTAGVIAVAMAAQNRPYLSLTLALCGVLASATAVRPERRPAAGYLAAALFVLATWLRLSASGVSAPEAYTLPVSIPALAVGVLRRRRDPSASSWTAYGAGLTATLVPSLLAAWGDPHWVRPLVLGIAALVITLAGARLRLQALPALGGAVLALDALHELAPYVVQVAGALPRWLPPALAGVLLLAVGATYEQRLRDARRLKEALGRMR